VRKLVPALTAIALVFAVAGSAAGSRRDHAATALNVLPPGQAGDVSLGKHSTDQIALYDGLTPLFGAIKPSHLRRYFKPENLWTGNEKAVRTERPKRGVRILRDSFGVPHVFASTRSDVQFAHGWIAGEDRGILMELARGPGRIAAIDAPGISAFGLALSGKQFIPSLQAEAFLAKQVAILQAMGAEGRRFLADIDAYTAGINAYRRKADLPLPAWGRNDVIGMVALLGQRFGAGGGDEVRRAMLLSALRDRLGDAAASQIFSDLRLQADAGTPVSIAKAFPYETGSKTSVGSAQIDDGSFRPAGGGASSALHEQMSNAILIAGKRSATGKPLMVAGPQLGFFYPEFFMEADLHGGGFDVRGGALAGIPLILIGRGPDFAWSATSAGSDNIDVFAETLCAGDDRHYLYKGACRPMTRFDAGVIRSGGVPDQPLVFDETVHGPVIGYATSLGRRVALASARSTRGREIASVPALSKLNTAALRSAGDFVKAALGVEMTFNLFYVDDRSIAMVSAGRLPVRHPAAAAPQPTIGDGRFEWQGFLAASAHPQVVNPVSGQIVNWNNKPAAGFGAADDNWVYGPVNRVTLLERGLKPGKNSMTDVVAAMNRAATQDIRPVAVLPTLATVLKGGPAPNPRAAQLLTLLEAWAAKGGSRLDRNLDGTIDDPGAAIMDVAWPKLADAVLKPVLGPLADRVAALEPRFSISMSGAWINYVEKDLSALLGRPGKSPFLVRYCGNGNIAACRASLWAALSLAGDELAAMQGTDPAAWRADATAERIVFAPGILRNTMRGANRPTFQQLISFRSHR
jgi:acyl-homoserine lactone acylase PvdQ